jgi:hypothetical protein
MVIPIIFLAFVLSTADSAAIIQADAAFIIKDIGGRKQGFQHLTIHDLRIPRYLNVTNDPRAGRENARPSMDVRAGAGIPAEDYLDSHIVAGFGMTIPLKKKLSFSLDFGYQHCAVKEVSGKFYEGRLHTFPLMASLRFSLSPSKGFDPYVFLGAGYIFTSFSMKGIITIPEIAIEQSVKNGLCLRVGLGIGIPISPSWGVFTEAAYFYREATGITKITDLNFGTRSEEFPVNLHAWIFQIGIKYVIQ